MDKLKQYIVLTVLGSIVVLAAGWFLLVSPKRSEAAELRAQAETQQGANAQLRTQLTVLKAQAKDLPKQQAKLAAVAAKIPDNPALPALIRALVTASTSAGVELISVTPGAPTAGAPAAAAAPVAPPAGAAAPAPGAAAAAAPVGVAGQLATIPLSLNVAGGYFQIQTLLANLENLPRSMRVTTFSLAPGANPLKKQTSSSAEDGRTLTTTITGQVFMAANRPPATPVIVPGQAVVGTNTGPIAPVAPAKK